MRFLFRLSNLILLGILFCLLCAFLIADDTATSKELSMSNAEKLLKQADDTFNSGKYADSRLIYQEALKAAEEAGNNSDKTEALAMIARTYLILDDIDSGSIWLKKAKTAAEYTEPKGWSRFLGSQGRLLWQENKKDEATLLFENMYKYCKENDLYDRAIDAAHMMAITGDIETQIKWAHKAIQAAEASGNAKWLGPLWNNLGATYEDREQYYEALEAYLKARTYHYVNGTETNKAIADWSVGHIYVKLGDYTNARYWLEPLLEKFETLENNEFSGLTRRDLAEIEFAGKNYGKAYDLYCKAEKLLKEAGMPKWDSIGYQHILNRIEASKEKKQ